ncbi:MAG: hypothetical protein ACE5EC_08850, partial [Phycisphaerae bacterium]
LIMSREAHPVWRKINNAVVVVVITFLIWFAADQNVLEVQDFTLPIRLTSDDPDRYTGFAEPPYRKRVTVKMKGRRRRLREFAELVEDRKRFEVNLGSSKPISPDPQPLATLDDIVTKMKDYHKSKLSVIAAHPDVVTARIDRIVRVDDVPVRIDVGDLKVSAEWSPKNVSLSLPEFVKRHFGDDLVATAPAEQSIRAAQDETGHFQVSVPLTLAPPADFDPMIQPRFDPPEVTITGRIETLTTTVSKGPIQVKWYVPDDVQKDYVIVKEQGSLRVTIDVTGPKDRVDQLDPSDIKGIVEVFAADLPSATPVAEITRPIEIILPPDFSDCSLSPDSQVYEVRFRIESRAGNLRSDRPG